MKKTIILALIVITTMDTSKLVAQSPQELDIANMKKYWWYRFTTESKQKEGLPKR